LRAVGNGPGPAVPPGSAGRFEAVVTGLSVDRYSVRVDTSCI